jgi:TatD DNase family protein
VSEPTHQWIDMHCHLSFLDISPEQAIEQGQAAGVTRFITIGTCPDDHQIVVDLAKKHSDCVFGTLGVHPHEAEIYDTEVEQFLRAHLGGENIVAVGEIGLDFYYDNADRDVQRAVFRQQLDLAKELKMPVEIHTRDAEQDTIEILQDYAGQVNGLIHCFSGSQWLADEALKLGFNISISGIVTFKKAEALREVVRSLPLDRIHVETDAPYLAPVPKRGKQNLPEYVVHTAEFVSELKGVSLQELETQTRANALKLFPKLHWDVS